MRDIPSLYVVHLKGVLDSGEAHGNQEGFPITGYWGFWLGLLPDDSPLVLKDTGTQDVVSLTFHEP
jgi:hypothetical protein